MSVCVTVWMCLCEKGCVCEGVFEGVGMKLRMCV